MIVSSWGFISDTLCEVGLHRKIIDTILNNISSIQFKLLWNGKAIDVALANRGYVKENLYHLTCL